MRNQDENIVKTNFRNEFLTSERCYISELLNEIYIEDVSLAIARVESGITTQLHSLKNIREILIFRKGTGILEIKGKRHRVQPKDRVIVPPNAPQRVTNDGLIDLEFYCLCTPSFRPEYYQNLEK